MCTWIVTSLIITLIYNAKLYSLITVPLVRHQRNISSHDYKASDVFNTSTKGVRWLASEYAYTLITDNSTKSITTKPISEGIQNVIDDPSHFIFIDTRDAIYSQLHKLKYENRRKLRIQTYPGIKILSTFLLHKQNPLKEVFNAFIHDIIDSGMYEHILVKKQMTLPSQLEDKEKMYYALRFSGLVVLCGGLIVSVIFLLGEFVTKTKEETPVVGIAENRRRKESHKHETHIVLKWNCEDTKNAPHPKEITVTTVTDG